MGPWDGERKQVLDSRCSMLDNLNQESNGLLLTIQ